MCALSILDRRTEAAEIAFHIVMCRKTTTVVTTGEALRGNIQKDRARAGIDAVHDEFDDCFGHRAGLAVDDVVNDFGVEFKGMSYQNAPVVVSETYC